jgi:hypothetical protein
MPNNKKYKRNTPRAEKAAPGASSDAGTSGQVAQTPSGNPAPRPSSSSKSQQGALTVATSQFPSVMTEFKMIALVAVIIAILLVVLYFFLR